MQLQYIYSFWHLFCQTFDTVSYAVYKVCDVLRSILIVHYNTMKSMIEFLLALWYHISYSLSVSSEVITCVIYGVIEFLMEIGNCLSSFLTFIWRLAVLFYHVVSVVVTALENLVSLMWTGSVGTMTMMTTSIEVLKKSWTSTWHKGEAFINKLFMLIIGGFETIGSVFIELVVATFNVIVYIFLSIPRGILYICDYCVKSVTYPFNQLQVKLYSFSKESFLGLSMCILLLAMIFNSVQIMTFLDSRGMTFPFFRSQRTRERNHFFRNGFDRGYNFEFSDNEPMENEGEGEDDDDDDDYDYDAEEDRATVVTNHSDISNHDSETESLSNSSSSISSEETSDSDIEIQLPSGSNRSDPGSRSPTPVPTKSIDSEYIEKEIERERDKRKCVVCQDRMKTVLILPCRHMCLCVTCAEHIVQISSAYRRLCPLCRIRIEKVMNVFV